MQAEPAVEADEIERIAQAYLHAAGGCLHTALRRALIDALADLAEIERRSQTRARLISRGYVRAALHDR